MEDPACVSRRTHYAFNWEAYRAARAVETGHNPPTQPRTIPPRKPPPRRNFPPNINQSRRLRKSSRLYEQLTALGLQSNVDVEGKGSEDEPPEREEPVAAPVVVAGQTPIPLGCYPDPAPPPQLQQSESNWELEERLGNEELASPSPKRPCTTDQCHFLYDCKEQEHEGESAESALPQEVQMEKGVAAEKEEETLDLTPSGRPKRTPMVKKCTAFACEIGAYPHQCNAPVPPPPKQYPCSKCPSKFLLDNDLYRHERKEHKLLRRYACLTCSERFETREQITLHMNKKHPLRNYRCLRCPLVFHFRSNLKQHVQLRHCDIPLDCKTCPICQKTFDQRRYMMKHRFMVHFGGQQLPCPHCPKICRDKYSFTRHKKVHHKKQA